jgi:hypothetical protein
MIRVLGGHWGTQPAGARSQPSLLKPVAEGQNIYIKVGDHGSTKSQILRLQYLPLLSDARAVHKCLPVVSVSDAFSFSLTSCGYCILIRCFVSIGFHNNVSL